MAEEDLVMQSLNRIHTDLQDMKERQNRIHTDLQDMKERQNRMQTDLQDMKEKQNRMQTDLQDIKARQIRMEQDHGTKLSALFDFRETQMNVNDRIFDTLSRMEGKIDQLSLIVTSHEV